MCNVIITPMSTLPFFFFFLFFSNHECKPFKPRYPNNMHVLEFAYQCSSTKLQSVAPKKCNIFLKIKGHITSLGSKDGTICATCTKVVTEFRLCCLEIIISPKSLPTAFVCKAYKVLHAPNTKNLATNMV